MNVPRPAPPPNFGSSPPAATSLPMQLYVWIFTVDRGAESRVVPADLDVILSTVMAKVQNQQSGLRFVMPPLRTLLLRRGKKVLRKGQAPMPPFAGVVLYRHRRLSHARDRRVGASATGPPQSEKKPGGRRVGGPDLGAAGDEEPVRPHPDSTMRDLRGSAPAPPAQLLLRLRVAPVGTLLAEVVKYLGQIC